MQNSLIDIKIHNGLQVVDSYQLYSLIGLDISNYARWVKYAKTRGGKDIDYFIDKDLLMVNRRIKSRYYFTIDFARAMCMRYRNNQSHKLIVFLKEIATATK